MTRPRVLGAKASLELRFVFPLAELQLFPLLRLGLEMLLLLLVLETSLLALFLLGGLQSSLLRRLGLEILTLLLVLEMSLLALFLLEVLLHQFQLMMALGLLR